MELKHICYFCGKLAIVSRWEKIGFIFKKKSYIFVCPKHCACTDTPIFPNPYLKTPTYEEWEKRRQEVVKR